MNGFDYSYTCPKINKAIKEARGNIMQEVIGLFEDACPLLPKASLDDHAETYSNRIYDSIESCFESVRATNEDMRKEAESQIRDLQSELADARATIAQLELAAA